MNELKEVGIAKKRGRPKKVDLKYAAVKLKVSKRKISQIEGAAFNHAAWGKEPEWDPKQKSHYDGVKPDGSDTLGFALNWYSVNSSQEKLKKWTIEYLESKNFPDESLAVSLLFMLAIRVLCLVRLEHCHDAQCVRQGFKSTFG